MGNCYKSLCIQDFEVFKETLLEQKPSGVANVDKDVLLALVFLYRSCRDFVGLKLQKQALISWDTLDSLLTCSVNSLVEGLYRLGTYSPTADV